MTSNKELYGYTLPDEEEDYDMARLQPTARIKKNSLMELMKREVPATIWLAEPAVLGDRWSNSFVGLVMDDDTRARVNQCWKRVCPKPSNTPNKWAATLLDEENSLSVYTTMPLFKRALVADLSWRVNQYISSPAIPIEVIIGEHDTGGTEMIMVVAGADLRTLMSEAADTYGSPLLSRLSSHTDIGAEHSFVMDVHPSEISDIIVLNGRARLSLFAREEKPISLDTYAELRTRYLNQSTGVTIYKTLD